MALPILSPEKQEKKARLRSLADMLHQFSAPAADELVKTSPEGDVQCFACGHRCVVKPGRDGVCRVRFNDQGVLKVPFGYVGTMACDPIEKKPFFHVLPGSNALTFGMLGCDYHCGYCQNWVTSQMLRDADAVAAPRAATPAQIVDIALRQGARVVGFQLQRAAYHQRMGSRGFSGRRSSAGCSARTSPTATARRKCSISFGLTSMRTRST